MNVQTVRSAHRRLSKAYGPLPGRAKTKPLDSLILTMLSQNTTDVNSGRAYTELRRTFPKWEDVEQASAAAIERAIYAGGLGHIKSQNIKQVLREIRKREGRLSLNQLAARSDADAVEYLLSLPGVGIKTAACVLMFSLNRPVFPVDTHVYRVTSRLGWIAADVRIEEAGDALRPLIPARLVLPLHLYLVQHGRETCKARNPHCADCALSGSCSAFRKGGVGAPAKKAASRR